MSAPRVEGEDRWQLEENGVVIGIYATRQEAYAAGTGKPVVIRRI